MNASQATKLLQDKKLLSKIDEAIDSGDIDKAYKLVGCSNPQRDPMRLMWNPDTTCKGCRMLGIEYRGADGYIAQYPKCVLEKYIFRRKELRDKIMKGR